MAQCVYCGLEAFNVIEIRNARTVKHASMGVTEQEAPREVIGRGYYACDGCLALLDYHVQHHLDPKKLAGFNLLSAAYHAMVVWLAVAVGSLAGARQLFVGESARGFLTLGVMLAFGALVAWFVRASVHSQYFGRWKGPRPDAARPGDSLNAMTNLRERIHPEFTGYLPVRYDDSIDLINKPGSPPLRCLGPGGEPWGQGPQTNFQGDGAGNYYRLVWISWQLWPLTAVEPPVGVGWTAPPPPPITEVEVAVATVFASSAFAALALAPGAPVWLAFVVALVAWPAGFVIGRQVRLIVERTQQEQ